MVSYEVLKDVFSSTHRFNVLFNAGAPGTIPDNIIGLLIFEFPWMPCPDPGNVSGNITLPSFKSLIKALLGPLE